MKVCGTDKDKDSSLEKTNFVVQKGFKTSLLTKKKDIMVFEDQFRTTRVFQVMEKKEEAAEQNGQWNGNETIKTKKEK